MLLPDAQQLLTLKKTWFEMSAARRNGEHNSLNSQHGVTKFDLKKVGMEVPQ